MRILLVLGLVSGIASGLDAQQSTTAASAPSFEVASVKLNTWGAGPVGSFGSSPVGYTITNYSLLRLISNAYDMQEFEIIGGPSWINTDRFDVIANAAEGSKPSRQDLIRMLQSLLAERFKLQLRREKKLAPTYSLVVARSDGRLGEHMRQSAVDCEAAPPPIRRDRDKCGLRYEFGEMHQRGLSLYPLIEFVKSLVQRPVIDHTGLAGPFDFDLQYDQRNSADSPQASIYTALQEQLGLKLASEQAPVETLVVEHADHPTPD